MPDPTDSARATGYATMLTTAAAEVERGVVEAKRTPGPWAYNHDDGTIRHEFGTVCYNRYQSTDAVTQANGHLIAAAPDMFKALADLVQTFHARSDILRLCGFHENAQINAACDALNKATGITVVSGGAL